MLQFDEKVLKSIEFASPSLNGTEASGPLFRETANRTQIDWMSLYPVLPNPEPVLRKTGNTLNIYNSVINEIKRESFVAACSTNREASVMRRKWKIDKQNASPIATDLINAAFKKLSIRQAMREIMQAWGYGYQVSEVVWERQGNYLLPVKLIGKPQRWYMFGLNNELRQKQSIYDIIGQPVETISSCLHNTGPPTTIPMARRSIPCASGP